MRKEGYRESTRYYAVRTLKRLDRRCNITGPESVRRFLANCSWSEEGRSRIAEEIDRLYRHTGTEWEKPRYEKVDLLPYIPKEEEVDALVTGLYNRTVGTFCLLLETGCRPGEAWIAELAHVDSARKSIVIRPEEGSRSRELKISDSLIARLNLVPKNRKYIFQDGSVDPIAGLKRFTRIPQKERRAPSLRLNSPRLQPISFRTPRHFKGTMEYRRSRDIVHFRRIPGLRSISNVLRCVRLIDFHNDKCTCKVAETIEAGALAQSGFEYVADVKDYKLFRKREGCQLSLDTSLP
jgi:integrase